MRIEISLENGRVVLAWERAGRSGKIPIFPQQAGELAHTILRCCRVMADDRSSTIRLHSIEMLKELGLPDAMESVEGLLDVANCLFGAASDAVRLAAISYEPCDSDQNGEGAPLADMLVDLGGEAGGA